MVKSPPDYYELLGVAPQADLQAIRVAYLALAKRYHPNSAKPEAAQSAEQFVKIHEAYEVLSDPNRRAQYDLEFCRDDPTLAELMQQHHAIIARQRAEEASKIW